MWFSSFAEKEVTPLVGVAFQMLENLGVSMRLCPHILSDYPALRIDCDPRSPLFLCSHALATTSVFLGAGHGFTAKFAAAKGFKLHSFQNFPVWARCIA